MSVAAAASRIPGSSSGRTSSPPVLSPCAGTWPPRPGSRSIAIAVTQPGQDEPRQRPPRRHGLEPEPPGKVVVDLVLHLVDELEEAPARDRDEEADDGREDEQHAVLAAADEGRRIVGECGARQGVLAVAGR